MRFETTKVPSAARAEELPPRFFIGILGVLCFNGAVASTEQWSLESEAQQPSSTEQRSGARESGDGVSIIKDQLHEYRQGSSVSRDSAGSTSRDGD